MNKCIGVCKFRMEITRADLKNKKKKNKKKKKDKKAAAPLRSHQRDARRSRCRHLSVAEKKRRQNTSGVSEHTVEEQRGRER